MNILYIDIDSLRPDHLGCYGYHRNTSPNIDRIAESARRFRNIYVSDTPCHPSRTALWAGKCGLRTGVVGHGGTAAEPYREGPRRDFAGQFRRDGWMWALRQAGYYTGSISSFGERHGSWHWYAGFNEVVNPGFGGNDLAHDVAPHALSWLDRAAERGQKWFLHVNFWDPHIPYRTPETYGDPFADDPLPDWLTSDLLERSQKGYGPHSPMEPNGYDKVERWEHFRRAPTPIDSPEKMRAWVDGYDTAIRYADQHLGLVLERLEALGMMDDTIIVISSDHGENIGELNVWSDHQTADHITSNVPLIIKWPGNPSFGSGWDDELRHHFDWAATLIEGNGGTVPPTWDGRSFYAKDGAGLRPGRDYLVTSHGASSCQRGVRFRHEGSDWMFIRTYHDGHKNLAPFMLYNLNQDPHEEHNLADDRPEIVAVALRLLETWKLEAMRRDGLTVDPLMTVIAEGGPFHSRGNLKDYLVRLRKTGRGHHADALEARHAAEL